MSQLAFPLAFPEGRREESFLLADSNRAAAAHLDRWGTWPVPVTILTGPRKSGRSLLARVAMRPVGGRIVDAADTVDETQLFHHWNAANDDRRPLVLIADAAPPAWIVRLPDLRSRLAATPHVRIDDPDAALVPQLIAHLFERRNLHAPDALVDWLARRVERTHLAIIGAVDALDEAALARRARLTVQLARTALGRLIDETDTRSGDAA